MNSRTGADSARFSGDASRHCRPEWTGWNTAVGPGPCRQHIPPTLRRSRRPRIASMRREAKLEVDQGDGHLSVRTR